LEIWESDKSYYKRICKLHGDDICIKIEREKLIHPNKREDVIPLKNKGENTMEYHILSSNKFNIYKVIFEEKRKDVKVSCSCPTGKKGGNFASIYLVY
jgi:hypothetical protein